MRRGLAIKVKYLDAQQQERIRQQSFQHLRWPWAFDEGERLREGALLATGGAPGRGVEDIRLTPRSLLRRFLRRGSTWPSTRGPGEPLAGDEFPGLAGGLMRALVIGGQVEEVPGVAGAYQLQAGVMRWCVGDARWSRTPCAWAAPTAATAT